jgi:S-adenosylmethionine:tRNA ribosyltransferase-isomerase
VLTSELDYHLPPELIAQRPLASRDASRMLELRRRTGEIGHSKFAEFVELLHGNELLVFNNARVIPARLFGVRAGDSAEAIATPGSRPAVEVFLVRQIAEDTWEALVRPGKKLPVGTRVFFGGGALEAEITDRGERGLRTVRFWPREGAPVARLIETLGHVPLPPYIEREDEESDRERYQTVFAKRSGAVAAPTAGLHFSETTMARLREKGIATCEVTLDVGLGTFQPVREDDLDRHVIHRESYEISEESAAEICAARRSGRPVIAIGTTVVRTLEDSAQRALQEKSELTVLAGKAEAGLFIQPGYEFRVADGLLTNFHLPRSTLLALVCAFAGHQSVMAAYRIAVDSRYRFYSYGDCMLIR